jgi:hypothetical protein
MRYRLLCEIIELSVQIFSRQPVKRVVQRWESVTPSDESIIRSNKYLRENLTKIESEVTSAGTHKKKFLIKMDLH